MSSLTAHVKCSCKHSGHKIHSASFKQKKNAKAKLKLPVDKQLHLKCDYCEEILMTSKRVKIHYKNLHAGKPIVAKGLNRLNCTHCDEFFFKGWELDRHLNLDHEIQTKLNYCKKCKISYIKKHKCQVDNEKQYKCSICKSGFATKTYLKEHISVVHEKNYPFMCQYCSSAFIRDSHLKLHIDAVHLKLKPHNCDKCTQCFSTPSGLKRHIQQVHTASNEKKFKCKTCGKGFVVNNALQDHIHIHNGEKPHVCKVCGTGFANYSNLRTHERGHDGNKRTKKVKDGKILEKKKFCCEECGDRLSSAALLKRHIKVKHFLGNKSIDETNINEFRKDPEVAAMMDNKEYKGYVCKLCHKKVLFGKSAHIQKYHTGNNIECPKCDKTFYNYVRAMQHILNVHEKKPCTICGEMFGSTSMTSHIQQAHTANDEKKFKCKICGKGFTFNLALQDHTNIHTGDKPYVCKVCGKGFANYFNHRTHERRHAGYKRTK